MIFLEPVTQEKKKLKSLCIEISDHRMNQK